MDGIKIIRLLAKLGELSGRFQAEVDMEQWERAVRIGLALGFVLSKFNNVIEENVEYCMEKFREADVQEATSGRRDVE